MSYTSWRVGEYSFKESDRSLKRLASVGAQWIALVVTGYQEKPGSTSITWKASGTPTDDDLIHATRAAHQLGLKVMLKPHVDFFSGEGSRRGLIGTEFKEEGQERAWFASYWEAILRYAELAQAQGVEQFCVGTELVGVSGREEEWRRVVAEVRTRFRGSIVYASNHGGEERSLRWWDAVDYIGVDAYYPLSDRPNPSLAELKAAWSQKGYLALLSGLSARHRKPVLFTEIGYRSVEGAGSAPWDWQRSARVSEEEQANCYRAAIDVLSGQPWFAGFFWWSWAATLTQGGPGDSGYTPAGKAAEKVLADFYLSRGKQ